MDNFDLKKYLAEGRLLKENKYDIDDPNSPLGQLNDNDQDVAILNNMTKKYGLDVVLMWMSSGEYGDREYFEEGRLLKEDYDKESFIKALGDADDAFIQLGDGREFVIYNPNSNNDDNVDMWGDYSVFAVDKDGEEHEILYSDIAGINL